MTRCVNHGFDEEDLEELDALVLAEMESLGARPARPAQPSRTPDRAVKPRARPAPAPTPLRPRPEADLDRSGEEFEGLFDGPTAEAPDRPEAREDAPAGGLLSLEEEAFVTRAVGFLSQREHADMILGRIWEQLTERDPEGFYQAPAGEPGSAAAEGPHGPPVTHADRQSGPES